MPGLYIIEKKIQAFCCPVFQDMQTFPKETGYELLIPAEVYSLFLFSSMIVEIYSDKRSF
jgi:hypothetical protein